jgi:hypothetical protein
VNYLATTANPFGLAGPPAWFLVDLAIFDPDLVLFPSQQEAVYRLGRKVTHAGDVWRLVGSLEGKNLPDGTPTTPRPDAQIMARHHLMPVTSILPSPLTHWGPTILQDLAAMDIRRFGGGDAYTDALEAREQTEEDRSRVAMQGDLDALSRDAYSDIVWKTGRRIGMTPRPIGSL